MIGLGRCVPLVLVQDIGRWDVSGCVHRAFDCLIGVRYGGFLLVPIGLTVGDMRMVIDRCPLPVDEVAAVLAGDPQRNTSEDPMQSPAMRLLQGFAPAAEWEVDHIALGQLGHANIRRLLHPSGIRYAETI